VSLLYYAKLSIRYCNNKALPPAGKGMEARTTSKGKGKTEAMEIKHKLWLEKDGRVILGEGREVLLRAIEKHRSLNAALKEEGMDMSYRAAWGRLKASEERLGIKLVASNNKRSGSLLTEEAIELLEFFEKLEERIQALLGNASLELNRLLDKQKQD